MVPPYIKHGYFGDENIEICHIKLKNEFMAKYRDELHQIEGFNTLFSISLIPIAWNNSVIAKTENANVCDFIKILSISKALAILEIVIDILLSNK